MARNNKISEKTPRIAAENSDFDLVHRLWMATQEMAHYMDEEDFGSFLGYCANDLLYRITAFSNELRKPVTFLDLDRSGLQVLTETIDRHVRFPNKLIRHPGRPMITNVEGDRVSCTTKVAIYHLDLHGVSALFAVANYRDVFAMSEAGPRLMEREVAMETRSLPFGCHLPL